MTLRPSLVCTRRSAESTRPPRESSRQSMFASIVLSLATSSGTGRPRAPSGWTPRIAHPAGFNVRTRPCASSTAMPSFTWLKNSSYRRNCESSRSAASRCSRSVWMRPALRRATAAALATVQRKPTSRGAKPPRDRERTKSTPATVPSQAIGTTAIALIFCTANRSRTGSSTGWAWASSMTSGRPVAITSRNSG